LFLKSKTAFPQKKTKMGKKEKKPGALTAVDKMQDCRGYQSFQLYKPAKIFIRGIHPDLAFFTRWALRGGWRS